MLRLQFSLGQKGFYSVRVVWNLVSNHNLVHVLWHCNGWIGELWDFYRDFTWPSTTRNLHTIYTLYAIVTGMVSEYEIKECHCLYVAERV